MKAFPSILITCKEAGTYIQQKEQGNLNAWGRFQLKLHLWYCKFCRAYAKQSAKINQFLERHFQEKTSPQNEAFKQKLKAEIQKKANQ
jgi:predicted anti-sigma-YlaC factor YlaD